MLKRDNWSTQDIVDILKNRIIDEDGIELTPEERALYDEYNMTLEGLIEDFEACLYPEDMMGAFAYDTERKDFVHIGTVPEEAKIYGRKGTPIE